MTDQPPDNSVWTFDAFAAREAQRRHLELHEHDRDEVGKRDHAIRAAVDKGAKVKALAEMVGMTRPSVYGILGTAP